MPSIRKPSACAPAAVLALAALSTHLHAEIYRWDNNQPIPGTTGISPAPNANLSSLSLQYANLNSANLASANFQSSNLATAHLTSANLIGANFTSADLSSLNAGITWPHGNFTSANFISANLTSANFRVATLIAANFTGSIIRSANLDDTAGFTPASLFATASYQSHDLTGILFPDAMPLAAANFASANLTGAYLNNAILTSANFTSANLSRTGFYSSNLSYASFASANLDGASSFRGNFTSADLTAALINGASIDTPTGLTSAQIASTASYQAHDLSRFRLGTQNLAGLDLSRQNLTSASLQNCNLTSVDFSQALVRDASFDNANITLPQLYSTKSYSVHDLGAIRLMNNKNLAGADLSNQDMPAAYLYYCGLASANFASANLASADLSYADLTSANFTGANLASANFHIPNLTSANLTLADLRGAREFMPASSTILRGYISPNATVNQLFTLNSGETFRVRPGPLVTINGYITMSPNATIAIDPGASVTSISPLKLPADSNLQVGAGGSIVLPTLFLTNATLAFTLDPAAITPLSIYATDRFILDGGQIQLTDSNAPQGYYKLIAYSGQILGAGPQSLTLPAAPTNFAYHLDLIHDPGFIDLHKVLIGDANADNLVDADDFDRWFTHLQMQNPTYADGDLNFDGSIDGGDLDLWFTHLQNTFGNATPYSPGFSRESFNSGLSTQNSGLTPIPEPTSLLLLTPAFLFLKSRRSRPSPP